MSRLGRPKIGRKRLRKGDVGTLFKTTVVEDGNILNLSAASAKTFDFLKPDGTTLTKTASFFTDGSDGIITYTTVADDLDVPGYWEYEGNVTLASGSWTTERGFFYVDDTIA